jgi:hypothetical protein
MHDERTKIFVSASSFQGRPRCGTTESVKFSQTGIKEHAPADRRTRYKINSLEALDDRVPSSLLVFLTTEKKNYNMQILYVIFMVLPVTLAIPTARGCGTMQDKSGLAQTMIGDKQCHGIGAKAKSMSVGEGCICIAFSSDKCSESDSKTWKVLVPGGSVDTPLEGSGVQWYRCSGPDIFFNLVSVLQRGFWECVLMWNSHGG